MPVPKIKCVICNNLYNDIDYEMCPFCGAGGHVHMIRKEISIHHGNSRFSKNPDKNYNRSDNDSGIVLPPSDSQS